MVQQLIINIQCEVFYQTTVISYFPLKAGGWCGVGVERETLIQIYFSILEAAWEVSPHKSGNGI